MDNSSEKQNNLYLLPWIDSEPSHLEFKNFLSFGVQKSYRKGSLIVGQGDLSDNIFYLNKGTVKIVLTTINGEEKTFWYTLEGNIIGDVPFFHQLPSNASIIADEDCDIYIFNRKVVLEISRNHPEFYENILESMSRKIRVLVNQIQDISFNNPTVRICKLLLMLSQNHGTKSNRGIELKLNITHKEIASITSVHRVTVTNVFSLLRKEEVIGKSDNGYIVITNLDKLSEYTFD